MKGDLILNDFLAPCLPFSTQSCSMECLSILECCCFDMSVPYAISEELLEAEYHL